MLSRHGRAIALVSGVMVLWTAVVIRWGDIAGIWVPDDPSDGGAVLAAQAYGILNAGVVWLIGLVVIGLWLYALLRLVRR
jgi:hypothetical protein